MYCEIGETAAHSIPARHRPRWDSVLDAGCHHHPSRPRRAEHPRRRIFRSRAGSPSQTGTLPEVTCLPSQNFSRILEYVGVWTLDSDQSTITFNNKTMWGVMKVNGVFTEFSGDGQITNSGTLFGRVDIKAASLNTKLGKRDEDLRSPTFLDVDNYPDISVVVTGVATGASRQPHAGRGGCGPARCAARPTPPRACAPVPRRAARQAVTGPPPMTSRPSGVIRRYAPKGAAARTCAAAGPPRAASSSVGRDRGRPRLHRP